MGGAGDKGPSDKGNLRKEGMEGVRGGEGGEVRG